MKDENNVEESLQGNDCGPKPQLPPPGPPGSPPLVGDWRCINGNWVWIEDIGG